MNDSRQIEIAKTIATELLADSEIHGLVDQVLRRYGIEHAHLSIAVLDDDAMRATHRRHLDRDITTDVISFGYAQGDRTVEGEVLANGAMAQRIAASHGWSPANELRLYLVHGLLHLIGFDDVTPDGRREMFEEQRLILESLGIATAEVAQALELHGDEEDPASLAGRGRTP